MQGSPQGAGEYFTPPAGGPVGIGVETVRVCISLAQLCNLEH